MSFFMGLVGLFVTADAFDGKWTPRKEWEVVVGLVLVVVAALVYCFADGDS